jgi:bifunctional enzyme Fae/Hps
VGRYSSDQDGGKLLVATAGGIRVDVVKDALKAGADILVVNRAITASKDIEHAAEEFLGQLNREEIGNCKEIFILALV